MITLKQKLEKLLAWLVKMKPTEVDDRQLRNLATGYLGAWIDDLPDEN